MLCKLKSFTYMRYAIHFHKTLRPYMRVVIQEKYRFLE